eukprot:scpid105971/ scgid17705/ 
MFTGRRGRESYRQKTTDAAAEHQQVSSMPSANRPPLTKSHYTFDFVQSISLPCIARQVGPLYFKVPRKVHLFGICNESVGEQVNYIIDEAETNSSDGKKSHNPNTVISLLHDYILRLMLPMNMGMCVRNPSIKINNLLVLRPMLNSNNTVLLCAC